jgi:hypothetical protein
MHMRHFTGVCWVRFGQQGVFAGLEDQYAFSRLFVAGKHGIVVDTDAVLFQVLVALLCCIPAFVA